MKSQHISLLFGCFALLLGGCTVFNGNEENNTSESSPSTDKEHEHEFNTFWSYNDTHHWKSAKCTHISEKKDYAEHSFSNWEVIREATSTQKGSKSRTCSICEYTQTQEIPVLSHTHVAGEPVLIDSEQGTCTEKGRAVYKVYCTICQKPMDYYQVDTPPKGHHMIDIPAKEPTCTNPGYEAYQMCDVCGYSTFTEYIYGGDHKLTHEIINYKQPKCTEDGWRNEGDWCSECQHYFNEVHIDIPATGHDWEFSHHRDATYTSPGYDVYRCRVCYEYKEENEEPIRQHTFAAEWSIDEMKGTHYHQCIDEGYTNLRSDEGTHTYNLVVDKPAGEFDDGLGHYICSVCQHSYDVAIPSKYSVSQNLLIFSVGEPMSISGYEKHAYHVKDLYIPAIYVSISSTEPVSIINENAFKGDEILETVEIAEGITTISASAFEGCVNLKEVILPSTLKSIEANAFKDCVNLENIQIPEDINVLDDSAFDGCHKVAHESNNGLYIRGRNSNDFYLVGVKDITATRFEMSEDCQIVKVEALKEMSNLFYAKFNFSRKYKTHLSNKLEENKYGIFFGYTYMASYSCLYTNAFKPFGDEGVCESYDKVMRHDAYTNYDVYTGLHGYKIPSSLKYLDFSSASTYPDTTNATLEGIILPDSKVYYKKDFKNISRVFHTATEIPSNLTDFNYFYSSTQKENTYECSRTWRYVEGIPTLWESVYIEITSVSAIGDKTTGTLTVNFNISNVDLYDYKNFVISLSYSDASNENHLLLSSLDSFIGMDTNGLKSVTFQNVPYILTYFIDCSWESEVMGLEGYISQSIATYSFDRPHQITLSYLSKSMSGNTLTFNYNVNDPMGLLESEYTYYYLVRYVGTNPYQIRWSETKHFSGNGNHSDKFTSTYLTSGTTAYFELFFYYGFTNYNGTIYNGRYAKQTIQP